MIIRTAVTADILEIQAVRNLVTENKLSDPALVTDEDCETYMSSRGKGWVCEIGRQVTGFCIADLQGCNIWALFVKPGFEGKGVGRQLHDTMLQWYFEQTTDDVWLGTAPGTRAATFYRKAGWQEIGLQANGEVRFEMSRTRWNDRLLQSGA